LKRLLQDRNNKNVLEFELDHMVHPTLPITNLMWTKQTYMWMISSCEFHQSNHKAIKTSILPFPIATRSKMDSRNIATTVSDFNPVTPSIAKNKTTLRSIWNHLLAQTPHFQSILMQRSLYTIDNPCNVPHSAAYSIMSVPPKVLGALKLVTFDSRTIPVQLKKMRMTPANRRKVQFWNEIDSIWNAAGLGQPVHDSIAWWFYRH